MKLYTKGGDDGTTGLFGGTRVPKNDARVAAYGDVDELNASIGQAMAGGADEATANRLRDIQSDLFLLGAQLATPENVEKNRRVDGGHIAQLEQWIDSAVAETKSLKHFVLPGGCETAAALHLARTVCRRAERATVTLAQRESVDGLIVVYLNRLSDLLFALARRANEKAGVTDIPWIAPKR